MKFVRRVFVVLTVLVVVQPVMACEWDYDTLQMERQRFPDALELITGKFLRHSQAFYEWRIANRKQRIKDEPENLALYDDLAVAYDKTGQPEKAIEIILQKDEIKPGLYETYANLGTFHIHAGQLEEGLEHIRKAIEINPDAHFGREVYQQYLVEYVLSRQVDGKLTLPMETERRAQWEPVGFAKYVLERRQVKMEDYAEETHQALKGVLGMLRFGNYDSPVLLEAAGDLLVAESQEDGKRLAARAYLKASYETAESNPEASKAYRDMVISVLDLQARAPQGASSLPREELEARFRTELAEAETWHAAVVADEVAWIAGPENPDEAFSAKYYEPPVVGKTASTMPGGGATGMTGVWIATAVFLVIGLVLVAYVVALSRSPSTGAR